MGDGYDMVYWTHWVSLFFFFFSFFNPLWRAPLFLLAFGLLMG